MASQASLYLRHYQSADFSFIQGWVTDERTHALWSGGHMPVPLTAEAFDEKIEQGHRQWNDEAFILTDEHNHPIGFASCSITPEKKRAHIKYVIIDPCIRGSGVGTCMMEMLLERLLASESICFATLNVFDSNPAAIRCYQKAGFIITSVTPNAFSFQNECWARISMQKDR